tara:strand:+ start:1276 stop:2751 length:1476 start_codon:yes stop_codon:yes gene_type:complete
MIEYEAVIGLEVHSQILTKSKMFCSCPNDYQEAIPNTKVCPVCEGFPGSLPIINENAVLSAIKTGFALNCSINKETKFDRKNYVYPDLMKGYQISQYDQPIASEGYIDIVINKQKRRIRILRVHLEEDVAKLQHVTQSSQESSHSLIDLNRSGIPLMEIVSHPDLRTPEEAIEYLINLRIILQYLEVSTGNMEEGSFRCDANISIRPKGENYLMPKVEIKNLNSFKSVHDSLAFEFERQQEVLNNKNVVVQETRGWLDTKGTTFSQRTKEDAHDYRYLPEPDLPLLSIEDEIVNEIKTDLPELHYEIAERFVKEYSLNEYDVALLTNKKQNVFYFEECLKHCNVENKDLQKTAKTVTNLILGDLSRLLNEKDIFIENSPMPPQYLAKIVQLNNRGILNSKLVKQVLSESFELQEDPELIVEKRKYKQIDDSDILSSTIDEVLMTNKQAIDDYVSGKETAIKYLIGQVMKLTRGQANPGTVSDILIKKLKNK